MNVLARRQLQSGCEGYQTLLCGEAVICDPSGVLYLPVHDVLVVADLHLEKGAAFARRGSLLPPYDTLATLSLLQTCLERYRPARVVCLGDSFHDRRGASLMPSVCLEMLADAMAGRDWIWMTGNHDPLPPPAPIGGRAMAEMAVGPFTLRHEPRPSPQYGEIAGHLHPVAQVFGGARSRRAPCFASDGTRMVMPAFGTTAGGLDVMHDAFAGIFEAEKATAFVIGLSQIYTIRLSALARSRSTSRRR